MSSQRKISASGKNKNWNVRALCQLCGNNSWICSCIIFKLHDFL